MPGLSTTAEQAVQRIEQLSVLDRAADALAGTLQKVIRPGVVEDTLSGTPTGHPAHPPIVAVPLGAWTAALAMDATGADGAATRRLVGFGVLAALPAAATGASDWLSTTGAERRVGLVHATANYTALVLQAASYLSRRRGRRVRGAALSALGFACVSVGGWLGGHLSYALGVGVDTTAFQQLPQDWADVAPESDLGAAPLLVEADGVPIVLYRAAGGVVALADRCTHRGGPLHEGELTDGCISCPWHGSVFAPDGEVRSGPAVRPQPRLDVRVQDGRVLVRRAEVRGLRTNPVGT